MPHHDIDSPVAIVGAGPYGLAAAAHLHSTGVRARVFGEPMEFWERHMPRGMFLRSSEACSQIADPRRRLTIGRWRAEHGVPRTAPVPLADFVAYGRWYQQHAVGALERQRVEGIEQAEEGFRVRLQSGEQFTARRVVLATGIGPFAWRPPQFDGLPAELASHTLDPGDLSRFAGRRVAVIGGGQSALESAALLAEGGAEVEVLVRAREIRWLRARGAAQEEAPLARLGRRARELLRPVTRPNLDIMGPRFVSWLVAWPHAFRAAPDALQRRLTAAAVRPAGASWLKPRLAGQRLTRGRAVTAACRTNAHVRLHLDDGSRRDVDHVLLATGYRVDIRRYPFLAPRLRDAVATRDGYPVLASGFESSVPGLHFLGTPAALSFGPLCRFVVGTRYAAVTLSRFIADRSRDEC